MLRRVSTSVVSLREHLRALNFPVSALICESVGQSSVVPDVLLDVD